MGKVINLSDKKPILPKSATFLHEGQRYTVTFDPNAPPDECWVWELHYVKTYPFYGSSSSMDKARQRANRRIKSLNSRDYEDE